MSELHRYQCHLSIECCVKILVEETMRARTGVQARPKVQRIFGTINTHS